MGSNKIRDRTQNCKIGDRSDWRGSEWREDKGRFGTGGERRTRKVTAARGGTKRTPSNDSPSIFDLAPLNFLFDLSP
jgi:hypothetical protein